MMPSWDSGMWQTGSRARHRCGWYVTRRRSLDHAQGCGLCCSAQRPCREGNTLANQEVQDNFCPGYSSWMVKQYQTWVEEMMRYDVVLARVTLAANKSRSRQGFPDRDQAAGKTDELGRLRMTDVTISGEYPEEYISINESSRLL